MAAQRATSGCWRAAYSRSSISSEVRPAMPSAMAPPAAASKLLWLQERKCEAEIEREEEWGQRGGEDGQREVIESEVRNMER
jgi:hypothetical protein